MKVREVMTSDPIVIHAAASAYEAAARMARHDVRRRRVVGILTETDLLRRIVIAAPCGGGLDAGVTGVVLS
jgi:CBS domain-containing protein